MIDKAPDGFYHPASEEEVAELVQRARAAGLKLRVRGSAHSVPASIAAATPPDAPGFDVLLDRLRRIDFDDATMQVTVQGGCNFGEDPFDPTGTSSVANSLIHALQRRRWALPATGGIIHQTMGGFLSTGSSGGSLSHSVSAAVVALRLVDGTGMVHELRRSDDEEDPFFAAGVSMGLLGVITSVTFQCEPEYNIEGREITHRYGDAEYELFAPVGAASRPTLTDFFKTREYGRGMWWPQRGIEKIVLWEARRTTGEPQRPFPKHYNEFPAVLGSTLPANIFVGVMMRFFGAMNLNPPPPRTGLGRLFNRWALQPLFRLLANAFLVSGVKGEQRFRENWGDGLPMDNRVDYRWTPTEFSEMWVPVDRTQEVMSALREHYERSDISKVGTYSVEIYATPRSPFWLSPAYEQDVVKYDMFWFQKNPGDPARDFYPQFWQLMMRFDCRFHWGKYMPVDPDYVRARYARWDDFMALRQQMDPDQVFVTRYWRERLGIEPGP